MTANQATLQESKTHMNSSRVSAPCSALLLFGATGDLAKRMLLPSLFALHDDGLIAGDLRIVGTARSAMSDDEYRQLAKEALAEYLPEDQREKLKQE